MALCYNLIVQADVQVALREEFVRRLEELEVNLYNIIHCDNTLVVYHKFCRFLSCFSGTDLLYSQ